jgi:hypothetical protein
VVKGLESFKFIDDKECLKKFREMDGKQMFLVLSHEIVLDNDLTNRYYKKNKS